MSRRYLEFRGKGILEASLLIFIPLIAFLGSLLIGRYNIPSNLALRILVSRILSMPSGVPREIEIIMIHVRLPRALAAVLVGSALALSGTTFQGLFRNPLVSAQILGVASGAGFGAALGLLISGEPIFVQGLSFVFGVAAVVMAYGMSRTHREASMLTLVLAGIAVGAFFSALTSLLKYVADPYERLPSIVFWLMGSLSSVSFKEISLGFIPIIVPCGILVAARWRLNIL